ncbi:MAG: hypothetical protein HXS53_03430 [Theionarchaea archaeon]|nr:hypothetical protein [Theionarchaea archaeon]
METDRLKTLEKKIYQSYFSDGFWDIFLGQFFLFMGIRTLVDNVWFTLFALSAIPIFILGKWFITIPRLGMVKFGEVRKSRQRKLIGFILVAVIATSCLLFISLTGYSFPALVTGIFLGAGITIVFLLMAYFMDFTRLYFYAFIFGISFSLNEIFWGNPIGPLAFILAGASVLVIGLMLLVRFWMTYRLPQSESF